MSTHRFSISTVLTCAIGEIQRSLTMEGVNRELAPLVSMTAPPDWRQKPITQWPARQQLFKSWVLLFGFLPIDRHSFYFDAIDPASGFSEASSSTMNRIWRHRRTLESIDDCTRVTDEVEFEGRIPFLFWLVMPVYKAVFRRRHDVLRQTYGLARQ